MDLCLHLSRTDLGSDLANRAARSCVVPPFRDGGQAQYTERTFARRFRDETGLSPHKWIVA